MVKRYEIAGEWTGVTGIDVVEMVAASDYDALSARLAEAERLLREYCASEFDENGMTLRVCTTREWLAVSAPAVQCDPPCPGHICRAMESIGACGLPDSASVALCAKCGNNGDHGECSRCGRRLVGAGG